MLSLDNMGLPRGGFRPDLYGRDAYGLESVSPEATSGVGNAALQLQLNDFMMHNSYLLQQNAAQQCGGAGVEGMMGAGVEGMMGAGNSYGGYSQAEIDRSILFEDLLPVGNENPAHQPFVGSSGSPYGVGLSAMALQPPVARERWLDGPLGTSPRGMKREVGLQDHIDIVQPRKKVDRNGAGTRALIDATTKRPSEQADHIRRERQRRDDMTSKFAVLESLLPSSTKRDRSSIVEDAIEHVKNLHHRIKDLQNRKVELKQSAAAASNDHTEGPPRNGCPVKVKEKQAGALQRPRVPQEELSRIHALLRSCLEKMDVHADLPHQVVIEMVCRPQPRFQSNLLQCLESLCLDVVQCTITKISHRLICVITAKPHEATTPTSGIVAALKYALQGSD